MKDIIPAINDLQLACMNMQPGFGNLADARAKLFSAIRVALIGAGVTADYLAKFDKMTKPE